MSERRCFAYLTPCHKDRERYPFQLRDGDAALCLVALTEPATGTQARSSNLYPSAGPNLIPFDDRFLRETDLILLTTRPPMEDGTVGDKKGIRRSYMELEEKLFEGLLRERFKSCARSEIVLKNESAAISPEIARRQTMLFR